MSESKYQGCLSGTRFEFIPKLTEFIKSNQINCLIFDCDGTLMDTLSGHYQSWYQAHTKYGYQFVTKDMFINRFSGISGHEMIEIINQESEQTIDVERVAYEKHVIFDTNYIKAIKPIAKILDILLTYHKDKSMHIALASGGHRAAVDIMLKNNNLTHIFSTIVTIEDVTRGKPSPEIFLKAASLIGVAPKQCLIFEDAEAGFQAAINADMKYINIHTIIDN